MAANKKRPTIESLIDTIGKLKSEHQRYIFKLNKKNEKLEAELHTEKKQNAENQNTIEKQRSEIQALHLKLNQFEMDESDKKTKHEFEVQEILDDKLIDGRKHYLVRWKGFDNGHDSWEPRKNLHCPDILNKYDKCKRKQMK